jgi:AbrB family looped-hinge helix DNA binding protein
MRTSIDASGRIVVPKPLREALGMRPGQQLELEVRDGRLEIQVVATPMRLERRGEAVVAVPLEPPPVLTADQVRETLEHIRR